MPDVCFVTGAHVDLNARLSGPHRTGYSNPGVIVQTPGGAGLNTASACASLGLSAGLVGPVGADEQAELLHRTLARRGIADGLVAMEGSRTGIYAAILACDGDLVLGVADLALYD